MREGKMRRQKGWMKEGKIIKTKRMKKDEKTEKEKRKSTLGKNCGSSFEKNSATCRTFALLQLAESAPLWVNWIILLSLYIVSHFWFTFLVHWYIYIYPFSAPFFQNRGANVFVATSPLSRMPPRWRWRRPLRSRPVWRRSNRSPLVPSQPPRQRYDLCGTETDAFIAIEWCPLIRIFHVRIMRTPMGSLQK